MEATIFSGHHLLVNLDWWRLIDEHGASDGRTITVTLTDDSGLSMSQIRALYGCGAPDEEHLMEFPLFNADTDYTVTVAVSDGLIGNATAPLQLLFRRPICGTITRRPFLILSTV